MDFRDVFALAGSLMIVIGLALVSIPLALVIAGLAFLAAARRGVIDG